MGNRGRIRQLVAKEEQFRCQRGKKKIFFNQKNKSKREGGDKRDPKHVSQKGGKGAQKKNQGKGGMHSEGAEKKFENILLSHPRKVP